MSDFYEKVSLVPDITIEQIDEMLKVMSPVVFRDGIKDPFVVNNGVREYNLQFATKGEGLYIIDVKKVDRRNTAYTWSPKFIRRARLAWGNGMDATIPSFHSYGAPSLFKPSLAETLANIRRFVPKGWQRIKYFWLDSRDLSAANCIGSFHWCRLHLFTSEFPE